MFAIQCVFFAPNDVDLTVTEYFDHVEEAKWAAEVCEQKMPGKEIAVNMCIGEDGDMHGMSTAGCAKILAGTGAQIIGLNCHVGPNELTEAIYQMKLGR